jgi:aconitate hydratase
MTLKCEDDYDKLSEGDDLYIEGFEEAIRSSDTAVLVNRKNGARVELSLNFTPRQREILLAGGTLNYTRQNGSSK